jgi:hypothetical protein
MKRIKILVTTLSLTILASCSDKTPPVSNQTPKSTSTIASTIKPMELSQTAQKVFGDCKTAFETVDKQTIMDFIAGISFETYEELRHEFETNQNILYSGNYNFTGYLSESKDDSDLGISSYTFLQTYFPHNGETYFVEATRGFNKESQQTGLNFNFVEQVVSIYHGAYDGTRNGKWIEETWWGDGTYIINTGNFANDWKIGEWTEDSLYSNGSRIKNTGNYVDGQRRGDWVTENWSADGTYTKNTINHL